MTEVRFARVTGAEDRTLLTPAELVRWHRLRDPDDRAAYVAAHVLARTCAAALLACAPADVLLAQRCSRCGGSDHGPPRVVGRDDVCVSLSHTRGVVAAVASFGVCGIDVERIDVEHRGFRPAPRGVLSARESAWVEAQADPATAFLRLWVRKEALVKCAVGSLATAADLDVLGDDGPTSTYGALVIEEWADGHAVGASATTMTVRRLPV